MGQTGAASEEPGSAQLPEELDLTTRTGETEASAGLRRPDEKPYDPAPERERRRGLIALVLVSVL
jgi:hypothetical protein